MTDRLPGIEAARIDDRSRAVMLCAFRLCDWQSPDTRVLTLDVQDALVREHLLAEHLDAVTTYGRLARDAGLIL